MGTNGIFQTKHWISWISSCATTTRTAQLPRRPWPTNIFPQSVDKPATKILTRKIAYTINYSLTGNTLYLGFKLTYKFNWVLGLLAWDRITMYKIFVFTRLYF